MLNELIVLQLLGSLTLFLFLNSLNVYVLWYLGGLYLLILGIYGLIDDADIFIGFLWVIDLGVGLVFFIFVMHFSNFLHQKSLIDLNDRYFYFSFLSLFFFYIFFHFFFAPNGALVNFALRKVWTFLVSWYDHYVLYWTRQVTELHLLREIYFLWSAFFFFLINFMLLYGLIAAIALSFLIKKIFIFLTVSQLKNIKTLNEVNSSFFIRNQNFIKQQNMAANTKVWFKKKKILYDF